MRPIASTLLMRDCSESERLTSGDVALAAHHVRLLNPVRSRHASLHPALDLGRDGAGIQAARRRRRIPD